MVELDPKIEGVTFLGGEPFDQPGELGLAAELIRRLGLSVMTFTGFYLKDLEVSDDAGVAKLIAETDLLVDGPFIEHLLDKGRPWLGSTNQSFHFLTSRYSLEDLNRTDSIEITVTPDGQMIVNGWASKEAIDDLLTNLSRDDEIATQKSHSRRLVND